MFAQTLVKYSEKVSPRGNEGRSFGSVIYGNFIKIETEIEQVHDYALGISLHLCSLRRNVIYLTYLIMYSSETLEYSSKASQNPRAAKEGR